MESLPQLVLVIIQNLHKIFRNTTKEGIKKTSLLKTSNLVFYFIFSIFSCALHAQNTSSTSAISEKDRLKFEDFFFDALTQKGIKNYQTAIEHLEECNLILPNTTSVLFEFSKNYLFLNNHTLAAEYAEKALVNEPKNIWILEHLVKTHKKNRNFSKAIDTQKKLAEIIPKKKQQLVQLYLQNKDKKAALKILSSLEKEKMLNPRLRKLQKDLLRKNQSKKNTQEIVSTNTVEEDFQKNKSYKNLKKLLDSYANSNPKKLLTYSEKGLTLFPAQPYVYLINGKALNDLKKYQEAIKSLENGIDFIIDNPKLEKQFYKEMITAFEALGKGAKVKKLKEKLK